MRLLHYSTEALSMDVCEHLRQRDPQHVEEQMVSQERETAIESAEDAHTDGVVWGAPSGSSGEGWQRRRADFDSDLVLEHVASEEDKATTAGSSSSSNNLKRTWEQAAEDEDHSNKKQLRTTVVGAEIPQCASPATVPLRDRSVVLETVAPALSLQPDADQDDDNW